MLMFTVWPMVGGYRYVLKKECLDAKKVNFLYILIICFEHIMYTFVYILQLYKRSFFVCNEYLLLLSFHWIQKADQLLGEYVCKGLGFPTVGWYVSFWHSLLHNRVNHGEESHWKPKKKKSDQFIFLHVLLSNIQVPI